MAELVDAVRPPARLAPGAGGPRLARRSEFLVQRRLVCGRNLGLTYVCRDQFAMELLRHQVRRCQHLLRVRSRRQADQDAFLRVKLLVNSVALEVIGKLLQGRDRRRVGADAGDCDRFRDCPGAFVLRF